jgi:hypothetical protein
MAEQCALARGQRLRASHYPVLIARDRANCFGFSSVSDGNSKQLGHTAIVGAHAVPALPAFATTLRSHGPDSLGDAVQSDRTLHSEAGHLAPTAHDVREQRT